MTASGNAIDWRGFQRTADGTVSLLNHPVDGGPQSGVPLAGISQGINDAGTIVGNYRARSGLTGTGPYRNHGYILTSSGGFTELTDPAAPFASVNARGIANDGTVVGFSSIAGTEGWIYSGGTFQYFTHPGDIDTPSGQHTTVFEAINNTGLILGQYSQYIDDTTSYSKAFSFDPVAHSFTDIDVPGALNVQTFGINDAGQYVVSSDAGQFIYSPGGPAAPGGASVFLPVSGGALPPGQAQFAITVAPGTTYYIDPAYASGFEYLAGNGPLFSSVTAPSGVGVGNHLALYLWDGSHYVFAARLTGGTAYDFAAPTARFELRGIPASAGIDPNNPSGFVTGLTFASAGQFDGFQNALPAGVPEPAAWSLFVAGFGVVGAAVRARRRTVAA
ncbi:MAG: PEP-CTERM sorting domain-containing protein [Sphingomonadaceae bacterium]|nr:PEP-CTERM sorting domain-containing protein [Sphingomonadaceae bacterium]